MLKLISLNVEGLRHLDRVEKIISEQLPDCICLMEMPACFIYKLTVLGYYPIFAPMMRETIVSEGEILGICIATRTPTVSEIIYYDGAENGILPQASSSNPAAYIASTAFPVIYSTLNHTDGNLYNIATTHVMVTYQGKESLAQTASVEKLISLLHNKPTHILCGDFNIPRGYNTNYELFTNEYSDCIPQTFKSSLDRTHHRHGNSNDPHTKTIFDIYMVDYIFSKPPYQVDDVQLQFGISDHAAIVANISK